MFLIKLTAPQLVKNSHAFYWTQQFSAFSPRHVYMQSPNHPFQVNQSYFLRPVLPFSFHLCQVLSSSLSPSGFSIQPCMCNALVSSPCSTPCPSYVPWFYHTKMCGDGYISRSSLLCVLLQRPVASFLFSTNRFLSIPFSDTRSRSCSSSAKDQISNPYTSKTRDNTAVLQSVSTAL